MNNKIFFPNLDGLRFIAFLLVFWQHTSIPLFQNLKDAGILNESYKSWFITGGYGVSFFFVLSGFLITYLLLNERKQHGSINIKSFYIRRILRIFPLYYLVVFFGFFLYPFFRQVLGTPAADIGNFHLYAFFLGNFDIMSQTDRPGFIGVLWSVCIEEQFYIVWALLITFLPERSYKYLFLGIILASTLFRFHFQHEERVTYFHTFSVISDLAVGGGMAYLAINHGKFIKFFEVLPKFAIVILYAFGFTLMWIFPSLFWLDQAGYLQRLVFSLFFAFIIAEQNYATGSFYKMKKYNRSSWLGRYTYGLYMLHMIALYLLNLLFRLFNVDLSDYREIILFGLMGLIISTLFSYMSYEFFEKPFLRLKRRFVV